MSPREADCRVLVIGAGAGGLSTAGALARRGISATVLDKDDHVGGTWERRYQCLKLHTVRRCSGLAHYPIPSDRPRYLSKDEYAAYLREYSEALGLNVSLGERVDAIRKIPASPEGMNWEVVTSRGIRRASVVVVATGHYAEAWLPALEGMEKFKGTVRHSSQYTTGDVYKGQNTLVIGLGNSGAEIAADLARHGAASVSVSVRSTPPIVTREMLKIIPVQLFGIALSALGVPTVIDRIGALLRRISIGDLGPYGLGMADWGPFTARRPAVIDAGFVEQLKQGRIQVRPEIERFDTSGVIYSDGKREAIDAVIAATGFRTGLEKVLELPEVIDEVGQPRFRSGGPTSAPGLYFIGYDETIRGTLFEIRRESKSLAAEIERYMTCLT